MSDPNATELLSTAEHTKKHAPKIGGYRELSDAEIKLINLVKKHAQVTGELVQMIEGCNENQIDDVIDRRWLNAARTDLQTGYMKLVRSIARPDGF